MYFLVRFKHEHRDGEHSWTSIDRVCLSAADTDSIYNVINDYVATKTTQVEHYDFINIVDFARYFDELSK